MNKCILNNEIVIVSMPLEFKTKMHQIEIKSYACFFVLELILKKKTTCEKIVNDKFAPRIECKTYRLRLYTKL